MSVSKRVLVIDREGHTRRETRRWSKKTGQILCSPSQSLVNILYHLEIRGSIRYASLFYEPRGDSPDKNLLFDPAKGDVLFTCQEDFSNGQYRIVDYDYWFDDVQARILVAMRSAFLIEIEELDALRKSFSLEDATSFHDQYRKLESQTAAEIKEVKHRMFFTSKPGHS